jgi:sugar phosphate isomerase/epimerase
MVLTSHNPASHRGAHWQTGRLLLWVALALWLLTRPPAPLPPVNPGPPQTVQSALPFLGVHTRLTEEVEPWKIRQSLTLVREMGAPWIVEFFPWAYSEPREGRFDWQHADLIVDHAVAQGVTVIARLGLVPAWARPPDTPLNWLEPEQFPAFAAFAGAFAERYRGRVDHIIIWNEPNLAFEWGGRGVNSADYTAMLRLVTPAIKQANPQAVVLAGALAPTLEPPGSPNGLDDLIYLEELYEQGAHAWFDALAVHAYGLTFPPDSPPDPRLLNFRRVELLRELMVRYGDGDTPVYITETGYNDHPRWTLAVSPAQRIAWTVASVEWAAAEWPWVEVMAIWLFRLPAPARSYLDYYTLVTPEFVLRPLYTELRQLTGNARPDP